jgi:hypothetical protein
MRWTRSMNEEDDIHNFSRKTRRKRTIRHKNNIKCTRDIGCGDIE